MNKFITEYAGAYNTLKENEIRNLMALELAFIDYFLENQNTIKLDVDFNKGNRELL